MWLFTIHGFYSIVRKPDGWHVRARKKQDIVNLKKRAKLRTRVLESYPGSDYPWRMIVSRHGKDLIMRALSEDVNYANFKSEVARTPGQAGKLDAYHEVWATMAALNEE